MKNVKEKDHLITTTHEEAEIKCVRDKRDICTTCIHLECIACEYALLSVKEENVTNIRE